MTDGNTTEQTNATSAQPPTKPTAQGTGDGPSCSASATTSSEEVDTDFHDVEFRVHVSMRYHQARRAWWTGLNRLSSAAAALAGSAAIIAVLGNARPYWAYVSATAGAFAALNAALGFTERAREHTALYDKFSGIAARMAVEPAPDRSASKKYKAEVLLIEASEPPSIHTLNVVCHNQECEARGHGGEALRRVYLINRIFKSLGTVIDDFPPMRDRNWKGATINGGLVVLFLVAALWYFGPIDIYDSVVAKFSRPVPAAGLKVSS